MRHTATLSNLPQLFARRLAVAMAQRGISAAQLAHDAGVSRSVVARYGDENSTSLPNAFVVARLAQALDVSTDYLLGYGMQIPQKGYSFGVDYFPDAYADSNRILEFNFGASRNGYFIYICHTLPEPLKTAAVLHAELEAEHDTNSYLERMALVHEMSRERLNTGLVLIDAAVLDQLLHCRGLYRSLTPDEAQAQFRIVSGFLSQQYPSVSCFVVNYMRDGLSTAFLSPPGRVTSFFFGGYLTMGNPQIHDACRDRALAACRRGMAFADYTAAQCPRDG